MYEDEDLQEIHEDIQELNEDISTLRKDLNNMSASVEGSGENVILNKTAEARFKTPPLPIGNSEQVQTTQSANLFDEDYYKNATYETYGQIGFTTLRIKGGRYLVFKSNLKEGKSAVSGLYMYISDIPHNTTSEIIYAISNGNAITRSKTFTATDLYLNIIGNVSDAFENYNIMIATSDIAYTPFVPNSPSPDYPQEITDVTGDVEVKVQNKNLLDWNKVVNPSLDIVNGTVNEILQNGVIVTGNTSTETHGSSYYKGWFRPGDSNTNKGCKINITQNSSIIISADVTLLQLGYSNKMRIYLYGSNNFADVIEDSLILNQKIRIYRRFDSVQEGTYYPVFTLSSNKVKIENIQIEQNTVATNYVEHKEQTFTFPLGNEKLMLGDYLADDGIHHVRGQIVLKGTEWIGVLTEEGKNQFYLELSSGQYAIDRLNENNSLCNFYTSVPRNDVMISNNQIAVNNRYIRIRDDRYQTGNDLRLWIKSQYDNEMPVIIEYILKEEVIVPYTSAQQEVYNQIKEAISYDEQTNVSSNTIALFNVKAFKNMNTSIESLQSRIELLKGRS